MAQLYPETDFGPDKIVAIKKESMSYEEYESTIDNLKNLKKEGYNRIKYKIKEFRSGHKAAIDRGIWSGSGRVIYENFDILQRIWGGSPAVTLLTNGICIQTQNRNEKRDGESERHKYESKSKTTETRKVGRLVRDTKLDEMKKKLSSHHRNVKQIDLIRQKLALKRQTIEVMKKRTKSTETAIKATSSSIADIGKNIKDRLTMLESTTVQC